MNICNTCGNTHQDYPLINGKCIFKIVQEACWQNGVMSDESEGIAETVLDTLTKK